MPPTQLRRELARWLERFSSPIQHQYVPEQGIFKTHAAPAFRALFRRVDELRALAKKEPAHRQEIEQQISLEKRLFMERQPVCTN